MQVLVRDNNVEQALRVLKKKMQREGVFRDMRLRDLHHPGLGVASQSLGRASGRQLPRRVALPAGVLPDCEGRRSKMPDAGWPLAVTASAAAQLRGAHAPGHARHP